MGNRESWENVKWSWDGMDRMTIGNITKIYENI